MPTEKPIIFCADMVRAILDGRKTQTRRIIKPQPEGPGPSHAAQLPDGDWVWGNNSGQTFRCPHPVGTWLWVRETWWHNESIPGADGLAYRAAGNFPSYMAGARWRSPIHMPRWASRITLEVTQVRVQRTQEISCEDALSEGVLPAGSMVIDWTAYRCGFVSLWNRLNAKRGYGWDVNPWNFAYTFKRLEPRPVSYLTTPWITLR